MNLTVHEPLAEIRATDDVPNRRERGYTVIMLLPCLDISESLLLSFQSRKQERLLRITRLSQDGVLAVCNR